MVDRRTCRSTRVVAGLLELGDEVGDRLVLRVEVEQHADVAELERAVDEHDLLAQLGGGRDGEVDRERRAADAALRAEDGDDLAGLAGLASGRCRAAAAGRGRGDGDPAQLLALARVDLADRGGELVAAERLDQELARAGEHRAAQVVGLALDGHHDDRRGRDVARELLGRRDAVHVRHVDVHQDDVRRELRGELERLAARRRGPDDVDVALEAEQLREVIARLRDVVDDQDADLVGHLRVWLSLVLCDGWLVALGGDCRSDDDGRGTRWSIAPVALVDGDRRRPGRALPTGAVCSGRTVSTSSGGRTP